MKTIKMLAGLAAMMTAATGMATQAAAAPITPARSFDGATIEGAYLYPTINNVARGPFAFVIGNGVEFSQIGVSVDFSGNSFTLTDASGGNFSFLDFIGFRFSDTQNALADFTSLMVTSGSGDFDPKATFDANNIYLNFAGLGGGQPNRTVTYTVSFANAAPAVPEPATWAMMLVGFGMVGAVVRHRRRDGQAAHA